MIIQTIYNEIRSNIGENYKDLILNTSKYSTLARKERVMMDAIVAYHVEPSKGYTNDSGTFYLCKIFVRDKRTKSYVLNTIHLTKNFQFIKQTFKTKVNG